MICGPMLRRIETTGQVAFFLVYLCCAEIADPKPAARPKTSRISNPECIVIPAGSECPQNGRVDSALCTTRGLCNILVIKPAPSIRQGALAHHSRSKGPDTRVQNAKGRPLRSGL